MKVEVGRAVRSAGLAQFDKFDVRMLVAIAGLAVAIGLVILHGDQVGLGVRSFGPVNATSSRDAVRVTFDESIVMTAAPSYFTITPLVPGKFSIASDQISFRPAQAWQPGQDYTVTVRAGMQASTGRVLKQDVQWHFHSRPPRVAFLGPVDNIIQNLYLADPTNPDTPQQLTSSTTGLVGFDVSPDGNTIVYAELEDQGASSFHSYDLTTGQSSLLYKCKGAACTNPVYRPDGGALAFERVDLNVGTAMGPGVTRIWVLDLTTNQAVTLFQDNQQLGYMPRWSPDGKRLAVYNTQAGGIDVHDFTTGKDQVIQTVQGEVGQFSPDGHWLFFPKVVELPGHQYATHLVLVDMSSPYLAQHDLVPDSAPDDDVEAIWQPDSKHLTVARRPPSAQGLSAPQLYSVDIATDVATPLVVEPQISHSTLTLSPAGDALLFQRVDLSNQSARIELWTYNFKMRALKLVAHDGSFARWLP